jgi:hypothetical protein
MIDEKLGDSKMAVLVNDDVLQLQCLACGNNKIKQDRSSVKTDACFCNSQLATEASLSRRNGDRHHL